MSKVAYQAIKYRQRDGWSHRDLLRLTHADAEGDPERKALFDWISRGDYNAAIVENESLADESRPLRAVEAYERAQRAATPADTVRLIGEYEGLLPREALLTEHLTAPEVNVALLENGMPLGALVRNVANLTRYGVLKPMGSLAQLVAKQITDPEQVRRSRLHPLNVLSALMTYHSGRSVRGSNTWTPVEEVTAALEQAFYLAFDNVAPTGKRHLLALDVSGSMGWGTISGVPGVTPAVASAVMAMVTARTGDPFMAFGFSRSFVPLHFTPRMTIEDTVEEMSHKPFSTTDCSVPMTHALEKGLEVDTFIVYTDNENVRGAHPPEPGARAVPAQHGDRREAHRGRDDGDGLHDRGPEGQGDARRRRVRLERAGGHGGVQRGEALMAGESLYLGVAHKVPAPSKATVMAARRSGAPSLKERVDALPEPKSLPSEDQVSDALSSIAAALMVTTERPVENPARGRLPGALRV